MKNIILTKHERKSNFELLRIISMLFIVTFHVQQKIVADDPYLYKIVLRLIGVWGGVVGVTCFVMIFAWFSIDATTPRKIKDKFFSILRQVVEYLVAYYIVYFIIDLYNSEDIILVFKDLIQEMIEAFMEPLWFAHYWFVTAYLFLLVLYPILNKILRGLSQKELRYLIIVTTVIFAAVPFYNTSSNYITDVALFVYIYFLTAYIKWYCASFNKVYGIRLFIVCLLVGAFSFGISSFLPEKIGTLLDSSLGYAGKYSLIFRFAGVGLFLIFKDINLKYQPLINKIGSLTFGIYLFHEHPVINVTRFLYNLNPFVGMPRLFYSLALVPLIFILGCLFESIRTSVDGYIRALTTKK